LKSQTEVCDYKNKYNYHTVSIKGGADLPILLIFVGVIGGLNAFGKFGLFIGPVILAITYTLLKAWIN